MKAAKCGCFESVGQHGTGEAIQAKVRLLGGVGRDADNVTGLGLGGISEKNIVNIDGRRFLQAARGREDQMVAREPEVSMFVVVLLVAAAAGFDVDAVARNDCMGDATLGHLLAQELSQCVAGPAIVGDDGGLVEAHVVRRLGQATIACETCGCYRALVSCSSGSGVQHRDGGSALGEGEVAVA